MNCPDCHVVVEEVPWAYDRSGFTRDFEEMVGYLAQSTSKTHVTRLMGITWTTVTEICGRVVERNLDPKRFDGLTNIGVDEFSYRRRHQYMTVVVDHARRRIIWAGKGRSTEALKAFFEGLTEKQRSTIQHVTMDMFHSYRRAVEECLPRAKIVFDRFHVQMLASDAVDTVRREQLKDLRGTPEGKSLFRSRFAVLKRPWNLDRRQREKLSAIKKTNEPLYRAYLMKEALAGCLDHSTLRGARKAIKEWISWASRSRLAPFVKLAKTIRRHLDGIVAYVESRLTNGLTEGLNSVIRMVTRRAFGFHAADSLISMVFLCCGGIKLDPPLPERTHR